ncbi:DNA polymerase III beta subunit [hydrothermal vent metagenome]|uniref:Beta sliding clamp n=1 Tax=hydrothermal vent metagenome TaxID=652676 RepID=A0A3B0ZDD5_9ZZZZ
MKFTIDRESFLKPLQQVIGVVERRQTLPVLGNLLINASGDRLKLTATDLEVEIQAEASATISEEGEITLPARKLVDICKALPENANILVSIKDQKAQIRSGKSRFTLSTLPAADFPLVEKINGDSKLTLTQGELKEVIDRTQFSMAQQDVRYYLNGLMLEMGNGFLRAVATDGHRLALCDVSVEIVTDNPRQVIVPRKGIQELQRLLDGGETPVTVELGANHIRLIAGDVCFTSKLVDGRFPDYDRVVPKDGDKLVVADRELFRQALSRTSILSNEKYRGIRLNLEKNNIKIQAHNPEQEEADEEFEVDYEGGELEIGFNVTYLLDVLAAVRSDKVELVLGDSNSSCLIKQPGTEQYRYVVMPMRL